ncbi:MAG: outer membrane protein assembly factor BamD [Planctomycetes bacterium]|nr:outer membrane protein assembly factor BamD [Planctomycetota bacterium]
MKSAADEDKEIRRLADTDGIRGPLERDLHGRKVRAQSLKSAAGREQFERVRELYDRKEYAQAEKLAKKIAKKYKNSPIREEALFLIAEAQFQQKQYSWAQDSYEKLVHDFPSTRYQNTRERRLFFIARYWMPGEKFVTTDDVKLVGHDKSLADAELAIKPRKANSRWKDPTRVIPILPNLWDRTRPVFDTEGRAIQALKSIWQHNPTGPLADDALMLTASIYLRKKNYVEADHIYKILREEYPKSRHTRNAFVLGGFVKQASYQGPDYDGKALDEAAQLKNSTLRLYPNHPDRDHLRDDLRKIKEAKAAADWEDVVFWQRKNKPRAAAVYCREILRLYPGTTYADRARQVLRKMQADAKPIRRVKPQTGTAKKPASREPRRLFRLPRFSLPAFPGFRKVKPKEIDSRSDPEKSPPGRVRV